VNRTIPSSEMFDPYGPLSQGISGRPTIPSLFAPCSLFPAAPNGSSVFGTKAVPPLRIAPCYTVIPPPRIHSYTLVCRSLPFLLTYINLSNFLMLHMPPFPFSNSALYSFLVPSKQNATTQLPTNGFKPFLGFPLLLFAGAFRTTWPFASEAMFCREWIFNALLSPLIPGF